jgi:hypothetical protein
MGAYLPSLVAQQCHVAQQVEAPYADSTHAAAMQPVASGFDPGVTRTCCLALSR